jgi:uncharacterized protein (TIGR03435 family)
MQKAILIGVFASVVVLLATGVVAQESYDTATLKRSAIEDFASVVPGVFLGNGRWSARGATLSMLLRGAYGLPADRILRLPSWARTERFDVLTTPAPQKTRSQLQAMAQRLLSDRFRLRAHIEQRINEVYALVRVSAGSLGPGLRPSKGACRRPDPFDAASPETTELPPCDETIARRDDGTWRLELRDRPVADLLPISGARIDIGEPIVDLTELTGRYDIDLEFTPRAVDRSIPEFGVPLTEAVERQLGLRFEQRKELVDVLIIDSVSLPSAD